MNRRQFRMFDDGKKMQLAVLSNITKFGYVRTFSAKKNYKLTRMKW